MCMIIADRCDEAEAECREILRRNPDDVQALTTLAAVKTEQKRAEDGREIALRLVRLNVSDPDDIYKIATVCCENGLHEQAYLMFCKLGGEFSYDTTVLYFKAISAYNCGRTEDSLAAFEKLLTINPTPLSRATTCCECAATSKRVKPRSWATFTACRRSSARTPCE